MAIIGGVGTRTIIAVGLILGLGLTWPIRVVATPDEDLKNAVEAYSLGHLAQARIVLDALESDPGVNGGRAAYLLGIVNLQTEKFALAESAFSEAETKLPVLADHAIYYRAVAAFHVGDYNAAAQEFQDLLKRVPTSSLRGLALFWEAESLWGIHAPDTPEAFHRYLEAYGQGAHAAQAWFDMGEALLQSNRWAEAAQAYRRVRWGFEGSPFWKPAWTRLQALAAAHPLPPDTTPPEVFYGRALADMGGGNFAPARAELQRVLGMPDGWRVADDALYQLGVIAFQSGHLDDAASNFRRVVNLHRSHGDDALYYLERIALRRDREADALAIARELIKDYPASSLAPRSLFAIGEVRQDRGALGPAMGLFREAGERFPGTLWGQRALWAVGWVRFRSRELGPARSAWMRVAQERGGEAAPAALYWAGRAAEALGQKDQAQDGYRRVAAQYPDSYYGQRGAARLNQPIRATVTPLADPLLGEVPSFDKFRELDALAQIDDATAELTAAAASAPSKYRESIGARLSQRYAQQGDVGRAIAMAEQVRDAAGGSGRGLPLLLWEGLYPQAFWETVTRAAGRTGVDPYLVAGIIREESRFDPNAVSPANAYGLMQLLPGTAKGAARLAGMPAPDLRGLVDPQTNISLGTVVLEELLHLFNRVDLAIAAYNAGPEAVRGWQARRGVFDPDAFVEEIPYTETRLYVKTVLQSAGMYRWLYRDGHPSATP
jgi:soluble lytic murein transglycosylase